MSEHNQSSPASHRQPSHSDVLAATTLLRLLSGQNTAEISELEIRATFQSENPTLDSELSCEAVMLSALEQATDLWRKAVAPQAGEVRSTRAYLVLWFTWTEQSGLGRFCPITKLLFAPKTRTSTILRELREIRSVWENSLLVLLQNDPAIKLSANQLSNAIKEIMGLYFARQFAMQADEAAAYPPAPWLETLTKKLHD